MNVLDSVKQIEHKLELVSIDEQALQEFASSIKKSDLQLSEIDLTTYEFDIDILISLIFTFNVINFCFWSECDKSKWTISVRGQQLDGASALFRILEGELRNDKTFVSGVSLRNITEQKLGKLLDGNVEIPLFQERLEYLHRAGDILLRKYDGYWHNVLKQADGDGFLLLQLLIKDFDVFDDTVTYKGNLVAFYKRAQLTVKMIHDAVHSYTGEGLANLDKLTAFADYKVPQILNILGILRYAEPLQRRIDKCSPIQSGSVEEIEIRVATIIAIDRIVEILRKKHTFVTSSHIDSLLWNRSQTIDRAKHPYHRTYTTAY